MINSALLLAVIIASVHADNYYDALGNNDGLQRIISVYETETNSASLSALYAAITSSAEHITAGAANYLLTVETLDGGGISVDTINTLASSLSPSGNATIDGGITSLGESPAAPDGTSAGSGTGSEAGSRTPSQPLVSSAGAEETGASIEVATTAMVVESVPASPAGAAGANGSDGSDGVGVDGTDGTGSAPTGEISAVSAVASTAAAPTGVKPESTPGIELHTGTAAGTAPDTAAAPVAGTAFASASASNGSAGATAVATVSEVTPGTGAADSAAGTETPTVGATDDSLTLVNSSEVESTAAATELGTDVGTTGASATGVSPVNGTAPPSDATSMFTGVVPVESTASVDVGFSGVFENRGTAVQGSVVVALFAGIMFL